MTMIIKHALLPASLALAISLVGCGGKDPPKVPEGGGDAGAGQVVSDSNGTQVGIKDENTSGLSGNAKDAYDKGFKAWLEGDLAGAKKGFKEASAADPKSPSPHYSLGVVLERLGELADAQQEYRAAFTAVPDHEPSIGAFALSLANSGHAGEADTFLTDKKSKMPQSPAILTYLAEVKSLSKDHGTAQQMAQDALRINPDFKPAMVAIARDHWRARKIELAKYALQAVLEGFGEGSPARDKDNPEAHVLRGLINRETGRRAAAMADFEAAYAKRPDMAECLVQLGAMKLEAGNAQEALPLLEKAVRYAPKVALGHLHLGDGYRVMGRIADAKREFDLALSLDSSLSTVHYNLGLLYLFAPSVPGSSAQDQTSSAIKEFETYKTMRGPKPAQGTNDDVDELLNRAKAKQAEQKNAAAAAAAPPASAAPAPAGSGAAKK
jgi:Tfp pilus assembly protein PilF